MLTPSETRVQRQYEMVVRQILDVLEPVVKRHMDAYEDPVRQVQFTNERQADVLMMLSRTDEELKQASYVAAYSQTWDVEVVRSAQDVVRAMTAVLNHPHESVPTWSLAMVLYAATSSLPEQLFNAKDREVGS